MLSYRLYQKPSKNVKAMENEEHRYKMDMKRKYQLPISDERNIDNSLDKLYKFVKTKAGENK